MFLGIIFSALGMHFPMVPVPFALQGPYGRPGGAAAICCRSLWHVTFCLRGCQGLGG